MNRKRLDVPIDGTDASLKIAQAHLVLLHQGMRGRP